MRQEKEYSKNNNVLNQTNKTTSRFCLQFPFAKLQPYYPESVLDLLNCLHYFYCTEWDSCGINFERIKYNDIQSIINQSIHVFINSEERKYLSLIIKMADLNLQNLFCLRCKHNFGRNLTKLVSNLSAYMEYLFIKPNL